MEDGPGVTPLGGEKLENDLKEIHENLSQRGLLTKRGRLWTEVTERDTNTQRWKPSFYIFCYFYSSATHREMLYFYSTTFDSFSYFLASDL